MTFKSQETSGLEQIIDRAVEQNPHSRDILKAFQPIIVRQRHLAAASKLAKLNCSSMDREKLKAGIPVCKQIGLFASEEPLKEIALSLVSAVKEGMPAISEGIDQFTDLVKKDKIDLADYFKDYPDSASKVMNIWAEKLQIQVAPGLFLLSLAARVVLENKAKEITVYLGEFQWEKGYCPICGEFPSIALIQEEGGKRFLHCSSCGYDWSFTRVVCPYCENEAQQGMTYFYIENKTQESAFICEKCRKYLVTLNRAGNLHERDMDISAITMIHMDIIMQERGYEPMTSCAWNILK